MAIWQYAGENPTGKTREYDLQGETVLLEESYPGAVLARREENYHDDSDFYAVVWDEEEARLRRIDYGSTRCCTYGCSAGVDATEEVIEKASSWLFRWWVAHITKDNEQEILIPRIGRRVKVVRGRKVPIGTEGEVFWYGDGQYRRKRVGIRLEDGEAAWTDAHNVEVIDPSQYSWDQEYIEWLARQRANSGAYHYPFSHCGVVL